MDEAAALRPGASAPARARAIHFGGSVAALVRSRVRRVGAMPGSCCFFAGVPKKQGFRNTLAPQNRFKACKGIFDRISDPCLALNADGREVPPHERAPAAGVIRQIGTAHRLAAISLFQIVQEIMVLQ